jgi:uncharacterized cupredoxin-like copper-binding protein
VLLYGLSTGHKVGLAVVGATFIVFALSSSFLFPRVRAAFPGRGLPAFIIVAFVFFFGMLTAVEVFGAEPKETKASERAAQTESQAQVTTAGTSSTLTTAPSATTQTQPAPPATTAASKPVQKAQTVQVSETEFKITLGSATLHAGKVTFQIKNTGKLPHDLAIVGGPKSKLVAPGGTATLQATLTSGKVELYCSVPGHKQAGMDVKTTVS